MSGALVVLLAGSPVVAQQPLEAQRAEPPQRIDLLREPEDEDAPLEDCSAEQEAAMITGEIIVCRRKRSTAGTGFDKEDWERRYARRTMNKGDPRAPDVHGIQHGGVTVATGCFIPPCPPPPAYFIDFDKLPDPPPGSDADRISRGLPPLGRDTGPVVAGAADEAISPSGSASPAEEPQG